MSLDKLAQENMQTRFVENPCRGIVIGLDGHGNQQQISWIMGRSQNSQNRIYVADKYVVRTEAADPSKVKDPRLIIYNVMRSTGGAHIVSNGNQTDTIYEYFNAHGANPTAFSRALESRHCEPDAGATATFTPRISGYMHVDSPKAYMSILKADPFARTHWLRTISEHGLKLADFPNIDAFNAKVSELSGLDHEALPTIREAFELPLHPGFGYCLTTYQPNKPQELVSFKGEPFLVPLPHSLEENMKLFWHELNHDWRVALVGKEMHADGSYRVAEPINRFERVGAK